MGKNVKKIQNMLMGNHEPKVQVGYGDQESDYHAIGDEWTDSDGYKWRQENGYRVKVSSLPGVGLFDKQCKDCNKNCNNDKRDRETFVRMDRCFHCQINFEVDLKASRIGENNNKHYFWVKLQMLKRWTTIDKEIEELTLQNYENSVNDKKLTNTLANYNQELTRESISKTT
tara:strand:+ start:386 stop:901 length:516 start_codon:yes stop_codon:yes gene_type:complete